VVGFGINKYNQNPGAKELFQAKYSMLVSLYFARENSFFSQKQDLWIEGCWLHRSRILVEKESRNKTEAPEVRDIFSTKGAPNPIIPGATDISARWAVAFIINSTLDRLLIITKYATHIISC
jgi:hypothetical protein